MILAGDVGGTKANLGLFATAPTHAAAAAVPAAADSAAGTAAAGAGSLRLVTAATFPTADFGGLAEVIEAFLRRLPRAASPEGGSPEIAAACFGVAGPVVDNRTSTPNLAWEIDGRALARGLGLAAVQLINDLVATAEGIPLLAAGEVATLQAGADAPAAPEAPEDGDGQGGGIGAAAADGNQVLIAAGTGLGMALLPVVSGVRVTVPSEGGHADYAPRDEDEVALLQYLRRRFGEHVSTERVVSGPGLRLIYEHLLAAGYAPESPAVRDALAAGNPSAVIAEAALAGGDRLCSRALDMFVAAYGAAAGNLALLGTALGGVYVGGGIAPKILPRLQGGLFVRAFLDKGRFAGYLERVPVRVVLNDRAAMLGAARCAAARLAAEAGRREAAAR
ncbi:MAG: glucokinase [Acidobacteria bacterium]|nr:glucokinase [Acidobacteriota bacterium]